MSEYLVFLRYTLLFCFSAQGKVSEQVSQVFGVSYDFLGSVFSNIARVCLHDYYRKVPKFSDARKLRCNLS